MNKIILIIFLSISIFVYNYLGTSPIYNAVDNTIAIKLANEQIKPNQNIIEFESKNPFSFYDIFKRIDKISTQNVYGILTKPKVGNNFPIIIGVAGSKGWSKHHYAYMDRFLKNGFAIFTLHSFESRNIVSTVGEQISATIPMIIYDAFMALKELDKDPEINVEKAGILGWSLGGGVALYSAWYPIQNTISPKYKFSAHLPFYPPCMAVPDNLNFNKAPIHILAGEKDNWVPADACVELVNKMNYVGNDIEITVFSGAHHSFDRDQELEIIDDAYSFTDCRMTISDNGIVRSSILGFPLSSPLFQKIGLSICAKRGTTFGGNKQARDKSKIIAIDFMNKYLMNN